MPTTEAVEFSGVELSADVVEDLLASFSGLGGIDVAA